MNRTGSPIMGMVFLVSLSFFGCGEKAAETVTTPAQKAVTPAAKPVLATTEKVEIVEPPKYVYDPAGRRDPFNPLISDKVTSGKESPGATSALPVEQLTPLQQFEIAQFRLIGVIIGKGQPTAMVVAPDGKAYVLKKGVKVGKNNGVVKAITQEGVSIEELYQDLSGEMLKNELAIKLPKREGA